MPMIEITAEEQKMIDKEARDFCLTQIAVREGTRLWKEHMAAEEAKAKAEQS